MSTIRHDLRHALRRLAATPGFTLLAVLTLALGVGAHTAIFGLAEALFVRPLPVSEPERLVGIYETRDGTGFRPLSLPDYRDHRDRTEVFAGLAAHYPVAPLMLEAGKGPQEEVVGSVVSANYFSVLGIEPSRGRFFRPEEGRDADAHPVAVVSTGFARSRLGGADRGLGAVLKLNGTAFTVVGVAPEGFDGLRLGSPSRVWIPLSMARVGYRWCDPAERGCTWLEMIGRLAPGRTLDEARAEMEVLGRQVRRAHPAGRDVVRGLAVAPLRAVHPAARPQLLRLAGLLGAAVTLVLLVAVANLGGLMVARALGRRREVATRLALGAPRWRVIRESVAEAGLLALAGGVAGIPVAAGLGRIVALLYPGAAPPESHASPAVLAYAVALAAVTGLLVGLTTGVQATRPGLVPALRSGASVGRTRRPRTLGVFVVVQVALSFVLLASTGLLVRSLEGGGRSGVLEPDRVATLRLRHRLLGRGPEEARPINRAVVRRLATVPGVESVTLGRVLPPWPGVDSRPEEPGVVEVGPRFFETFGFQLARGRGFDERDRIGSAPVAVVNRALADARWPDRDPLGRLLKLDDRTLRVAGVVEDRAVRSVGQIHPHLVYTPYWQDPELIDARIAVRTEGDAADLLPVLHRELRAVDPASPITELVPLTTKLERFLGPVRLAGRVLGASGALGLLLSAVGLYGVLALTVARRRREIGIRMALGGDRGRVVGLVVRDAALLVGVGLTLGLGAAGLAGRALVHSLYGVSPHDPVAFGAALAVFVPVAALASWWPARRAAAVDPARTLRREEGSG